MISKEVFIKTMERLESLNKRMEAANNAMHDLCVDSEEVGYELGF